MNELSVSRQNCAARRAARRKYNLLCEPLPSAPRSELCEVSYFRVGQVEVKRQVALLVLGVVAGGHCLDALLREPAQRDLRGAHVVCGGHLEHAGV